MVHKRCHENGCKEGAKENPRCDHGCMLHGEHTPRDGHRFVERGPMKHYLWLAPAGTQLPENRTQAEDLEKLDLRLDDRRPPRRSRRHRSQRRRRATARSCTW